MVPGYRATVVDDAMNELPRGTAGKLAVKGPTGCRYLDDDRQRNYVRDGWNLTGDTFVQDDDGYFRYQARSDDMIVTSGYNVAGPEVEGALLLHPAVAECGVVGVADGSAVSASPLTSCSRRVSRVAPTFVPSYRRSLNRRSHLTSTRALLSSSTHCRGPDWQAAALSAARARSG